MGKKFAPKVAFVQKVVILHPTEEKILILKRNPKDKSRPADIDVPGGSVHEGEPHDEALKREAFEETKLEIDDIRPLLVKTEPHEDDYFLFIGYCARALTEAVILDKREHDSFEWIHVDDFRRKYSSHILNEIVEKI